MTPLPLENRQISINIDDLLESQEYPFLDRIVGFLNNHIKILWRKTFKYRHLDGDCRDYAFEYLGLNHYKYSGGIDDVTITSKLRNNELPDLVSTDKFEINVLVAYFCKGKYGDNYIHYGVCVGFEGDIPIIESLWGEHGIVVRHHLKSVASYHGNHVEIYKKI